jgi:hypothetical protein
MLREASTRTAPRRTALRFDDGAPGPWQRAMLTPSGSQSHLGGLAVGALAAPTGAPSLPAATGMKKCAAFPGGALTDFGFQKRGVGWVRAPARACASARSRAVAQGQEEAAIVFLHLSSFADNR